MAARNTLTQRAIGPVSSPVATLDASGLVEGDIAGLALLGLPYYWIGVRRTGDGYRIAWHNQHSGRTLERGIDGPIVRLRVDCNFLVETAHFSYATGADFVPFGDVVPLVYQLKTFQGTRYSLFAYNTRELEGGYADFADFTVEEPFPHGLMEPIPYGETGNLRVVNGNGGIGPVRIEDRGLGRVALVADRGTLTIAADGAAAYTTSGQGAATEFQWMETPYGQVILMSLVTSRYLQLDPATGRLAAVSPGPRPDPRDGVRFDWEPV